MSALKIFGLPTLLAALSIAGMVVAFNGGGIWDVLAWITLAPVVAVCGLALHRAFAR